MTSDAGTSGRSVMVTGGAGYVGSVLVPKLLAAGHRVTVLDLFIYGDTLAGVADHPGLRQVRGDLRDAFRAGEGPDPMNDPLYYNIKRMQELSLR